MPESSRLTIWPLSAAAPAVAVIEQVYAAERVLLIINFLLCQVVYDCLTYVATLMTNAIPSDTGRHGTMQLMHAGKR